jgi:hypothetical protein
VLIKSKIFCPNVLKFNCPEVHHAHRCLSPLGNFPLVNACAGLEASPKEFYSNVEAAVKECVVPGLEVSRVDWKEGGILTADREYLRVSRGRLIFDICAAPFGNGFFFSWWLTKSPGLEEPIMSKAHSAYIDMRCNIDAVFEHYAQQSEYYKRANIQRRFLMEDRFYNLSMELLSRIIGPFEIIEPEKLDSGRCGR